MSEAFIPRTRNVHPPQSAPAGEHRPLINKAAKQVSARERREQLLAYHVACRLLEEKGVRKKSGESEESDVVPKGQKQFGHSFMGRDALDGDLTPPTDPSVERVLAAVESFERAHGRVLHQAISLNFTDAHGNPTLGGPLTHELHKHFIPMNGGDGHNTLDTEPSDRTGKAANNIVNMIFSKSEFSYFDEKRKQMFGAKEGIGGIQPPTAHSINAMKQRLPPETISERNKRSLAAQRSNKGDGSGASSGAPKDTVELWIPPGGSIQAVQEALVSRNKRLTGAINMAVAQYVKQTTGKKKVSLDANDGPMSIESWLANNVVLRDAVSACTDLVTMCLMKAVPTTLFAGDRIRFHQLLAEEKAVLEHKFSMEIDNIDSPHANSKESQANGLFGVSLTPLTDMDSWVEQAMVALQQRISQRAEGALSPKNSNRLFLLTDVQSMVGTGTHLSSFFALFSGEKSDKAIRGDSAGVASSMSPRRAERVELERERRKREASRPPADPLQAVATRFHCWLSLTTSRLRQFPLHACGGLTVRPPQAPEKESNERDVMEETHRSGPTSPMDGDRRPRFEEDFTASQTTANLVASREQRSLSISRGHSAEATRRGVSARNRGAITKAGDFSQPEVTILPLLDLINALRDSNESSTSLQEVVGPVELRLLLHLSTCYASLVHSVHCANSMTEEERFVDRRREQILRAVPNIIVNASMLFADSLVCSADGSTGLPKPRLQVAHAANDSDIPSPVTSVPPKLAENPFEGDEYVSLVRTLPGRVQLSKEQVQRLLQTAPAVASAGGVLVGNEQDAHRLAVQLLEQNRAVIHEALTRIKGELVYLLTGVDVRDKIIEEEQISLEAQQRERVETKKHRQHNATVGAAARFSVVGIHTDHHGAHHHHPSSLSKKESFRFGVTGSDMVGVANSARFQAILDDLVGSSSEEEELRRVVEEEQMDTLRPTFEWQRQNYHEGKPVRRHRRYTKRTSPKNQRNERDVSSVSQSRASSDRSLPSSPTRATKPPSPSGTTKLPSPTRATKPPSPSGTAKLPSPTRTAMPSSPTKSKQLPESPKGVSKTAEVKQTKVPFLMTDIDADVLLPSFSATDFGISPKALPSGSVTLRPKAPLAVAVDLSPKNSRQNPLGGTAGFRKGPSALDVSVLSVTSVPSPRTEFPRAVVINTPSKQDSNQRRELESSVRLGRSQRLGNSIRKGPPTPYRNNKVEPLAPEAPTVKEDENPLHQHRNEAMNHIKSMSKQRVFMRNLHQNTHKDKEHGITAIAVQVAEKTKATLRAPEDLTITALQRELVTLERNRRRAGRSMGASPSPTRQAKKEVTAEEKKGERDVTVTESVIGPGAAVVVEKFKKACSSTIQHQYGYSTVWGGGAPWYEQGRPSAAERGERVAALRGIQQGRFDLSGVTPLAALRLAMTTGAPTSANQVATEDGTDGASFLRQPELAYERPSTRGYLSDLPWTL